MALSFLSESTKDFQETATVGGFRSGVSNTFDDIFQESYENMLQNGLDVMVDCRDMIKNKAKMNAYKDSLLGELQTECAEMQGDDAHDYGTHAHLYEQVSDMFDNCVEDLVKESTRVGELLPIKAIDFPILVKQQLQREHKTGGEYLIVPPKNGKKRYIPMAPSVAKLFALQWQRQECLRKEQGLSWQNCGMVFTNPTGGYLSSRTVYDCFKRLAKKIGAPNARVHDLRHTYAMACIESGVDIKTLQENLGHATAAFTLDVYGHVTAKMKQESAARMQKFFENLSA